MLNSPYIDTASLKDLQLSNGCGGDEEGDVELGSNITVRINCVTLQNCLGHAVKQLVEALCYKSESRGFDSR